MNLWACFDDKLVEEKGFVSFQKSQEKLFLVGRKLARGTSRVQASKLFSILWNLAGLKFSRQKGR